MNSFNILALNAFGAVLNYNRQDHCFIALKSVQQEKKFNGTTFIWNATKFSAFFLNSTHKAVIGECIGSESSKEKNWQKKRNIFKIMYALKASRYMRVIA